MGSPSSVPRDFKATLERMGPEGAWTCIRVPFDVEEAFGSKARVSVAGTINGFAFRSSVFPSGEGTHFMMVNKAMRQGAGVEPGDQANVVLKLDTAPRTLTIPQDLQEALAGSRQAQDRFEGMAYSHKKEYVDWIEEAKRPETRARRIQRALAMLTEGKRLKG